MKDYQLAGVLTKNKTSNEQCTEVLRNGKITWLNKPKIQTMLHFKMKGRLLILAINLFFSCLQWGFQQNIQIQRNIIKFQLAGALEYNCGIQRTLGPISQAYQVPISCTQIVLGPKQLSIYLESNQVDTWNIRSQLAGHLSRVQLARHMEQQVPIS